MITTPRKNAATLFCDGSAQPNPGHGAGARTERILGAIRDFLKTRQTRGKKASG
jgi:hypothetical protein